MGDDLLIRDASIFAADTPDPARARARAGCVAVRGDRIVAVGDEDRCRRAVPGAEVIDAGGGSLLPGLIDCHAHLLNLGETHVDLDLRGMTDMAGIVELVAARARELPEGTWIVGRGWAGDRPAVDRLSAAVPGHPVLLNRFDGHGAIANRAALRLAGIERDTPDPSDGRVLRDETGEPTGVLVEGAARPVREAVPPMDGPRRRELLRLGARDCLALGLTGLHDAIEDVAWLDAYPGLDGPRVFGMLNAPEEGDLAEFAAEHLFAGDASFGVRRLRLIFDGGLGARGALLSRPYADDPSGAGFRLMPVERVVEAGRAVRRLGFDLVVHAIGDLANRLVLDAFETVGDARGFMIEHASVMTERDRDRLARLGVIASVQPVHVTDDLAWTAHRLGEERARDAYAFRDLLDRGALLACGSDFPVASPNPFHGIHAAETRRRREGGAEVGQAFGADQRVTRAEAIYGYTRWAARAAGLDHELGSVEPGKLADLVLLDRDIMAVTASEVADATVRHTIVGGRVRHEGSPRC
ncbi:amidohydrolase [Microtetraspora fusca]|uniref:Amidohydrolase n=1 Tax=Microtetraspora fusca TaxID=1997 RepID=A0ABW6VG80_MICFU